ncbi:MAG: hypothetical protein KatS3mg029_0236 [Saprospiraceae bacterium]|nr:MAG: hypothetical protein KatS3mg029_0236 [Saprospiraceae bacterium]
MLQYPISLLLSICLLCLLQTPLSAQSARAFEKAGDKAFGGKDYYTAFTYFAKAASMVPDDVSLLFKKAEAARLFNAVDTALTAYGHVVETDTSGAFTIAHFHIGQLWKVKGDYEAARKAFEQYLAIEQGDLYHRQWAEEELETCRWAATAVPPDSLLIRIENPGRSINTPWSEFGPWINGDTLYYSSFRYDFDEDNHKPKRKLSKVLWSIKGSRGRPVPRNFNLPDKHTAHTSISVDGSRLYFTICEYVGDADIRCQIFYRQRDRRGRWEIAAHPLESEINMPGYTATHPAAGFDSVLNKEVLFFASDRPGGKGGLDIWMAVLDSGRFAKPINLEPINTPENELTPFFHTPTQTLWFSSDRHPGLGGYDVFHTTKSQSWGPVVNAGLPINSSWHDLYFVCSSDQSKAWLASNRPGAQYLHRAYQACCYDLWALSFEAKPDSPAIAPTPPPLPLPPEEPTKLVDFLPLKLYFDNDEPDRRTTRETTRKTYAETYEKYYNRKKTYIERYTQGLEEDDALFAADEMEHFFENEVRKGMEYLDRFCEILLDRLQNGDTVEIVLKGFTSPRAESNYNDRLARRRIASVRNQFLSWADGALKPYLEQGQLIFSEAPFGETMAAPVSDDLSDERSSIYSVEAARERRVEVVEVHERRNER